MSGLEDKPVLKAKYRNRTEIIVPAPASVLRAAKMCDGISKTKIMFTAYLSMNSDISVICLLLATIV